MRFLAIAMATILTFGFVSCGPDDEETPYEGIELANGEFIEIESFGSDSTAAYKLHFKTYLRNDSIVIESLSSNISISGMPDMDCRTSALVADMGKVKALSKIDEIPAESELAQAQKAEEKHGYVVVVKGIQNVNAYQNPTIHDPETQYMRIWLEEKTDNGYKLRYGFPFTPAE